VGVKIRPQVRNPLFQGPLEAKDIALARRKARGKNPVTALVVGGKCTSLMVHIFVRAQ
jgi:hypothetical protein